jgi:hypothetical protein
LLVREMPSVRMRILMSVTGIEDPEFAREFLQNNGWQLAIDRQLQARAGGEPGWGWIPRTL